MKKLQILLAILFIISIDAKATPKEEFTCEKIKEKAVRLSCIESRRQKTSAADSAKEKEKEIEKFVTEAKAVLVKDFKDPASAQFTGLFLSTKQGMKGQRRVLCGMVNAKNSYGGYVGAKTFYVQDRSGDLEMYVWISGDTDTSSHTQLAEVYCSGEIIPVK